MDIPNTYLFTAYYDDGEEYIQGTDDISTEVEDKNAFYDIWYNPIKPLTSLFAFRLTEIAADDPQTFAVNLRTGIFEINGYAFYQHGHNEALKDFQLIYYRVPAPRLKVTIDAVTGEQTHEDDGYSLGY